MKDNKLSTWLTVLPLEKNQFDLSAKKFHDGLVLSYKKSLLHPPLKCDCCGTLCSVEHAFDCRNGGLVGQ